MFFGSRVGDDASLSPSWVAWIEISQIWSDKSLISVAPPRGERGLKYDFSIFHALLGFVAPPRGERGLKYRLTPITVTLSPSLPLVGSVD